MIHLENIFQTCKEANLQHRYITNNHIEPLLKNLSADFKISTIGTSVNKLPIYGVEIGTGDKKILMWSQMHGNESTTTKVLFDVFNGFSNGDFAEFLKSCTFYLIPILNPDGAKAYTRVNANNVDLNRDAQNLSQPESKVLRRIFDEFKPDYCFNLHGQRTIFSAGKANASATISFLAPAQDKECTVTANRQKAMELISGMNVLLQQHIPNQVGIYDDAFNINCVGDTFQSQNVPTILFEAGHFANDYAREVVRKYLFMSMIVALDLIVGKHQTLGSSHKGYFDIPENEKLFYDIIIRNAKVKTTEGEEIKDIAFQFEEVLKEGRINFIPVLKDFGDLSRFYAHETLEANLKQLELPNNESLKTANSIDFVIIDNKVYPLNSVNN